jgi:small-conductance mechanosensitive channel
MSLANPSILAATFWHRHDNLLTAGITVVVAFLLATLVDRLFARRALALARAMAGGRATAVVDTRLLFVRRLVYAAIVVLGFALALAQFDALSTLASGFLASGAIAAAVIGFAARQTLANAVAGVMLAVAQPFRVGDHIVFEGEAGTVDDIRLTYTYLHATGDTRVVIPNERLAAGILRNDTILDPTSPPSVSIWVSRDADVPGAVDALTGRLGVQAAVADITADGVRIDVTAAEPAPGDRDPDRAAREAGLRLECLRVLREAGVTR